MELDLNKAQKGEPIVILYMGKKITLSFANCDISQEMQDINTMSFRGYTFQRPAMTNPRFNVNLTGYAIQVEPDENFDSLDYYGNPFGIPGYKFPGSNRTAISKKDISNASIPTDNDIEKYFSNPDEVDLSEEIVDGGEGRYLGETTY